jgi:hypothetical protein
MPVRVYSGIAPPQALLDAMAASGQVKQAKPTKPTKPQKPEPAQGTGDRPPIPPRPAAPSEPAAAEENPDDEAPPSYEDAMAEVIGPVDGPRREYNPPDAAPSGGTIEPGADTKPSVHPGKDPESAPYTNPENNSSSESFDMLPSTPPETQSNSPPMSPVARQPSTLKTSRGEDNPPQYQSALEPQLHVGHNPERRPSRPEPRPTNLGVPSRKPVPGSPGSRGG